MLNNRGPNTEPCGTPHNNSIHELKDVLILVLCHLLSK